MDNQQLPQDFNEFLKLLNSHRVEYLLIGGYAVGYYGYARATGDMDVWIARTDSNADRIIAAIEEFGFERNSIDRNLFLAEHQVTRMGIKPMRIEILTSISGVSFDDCYPHREIAVIDGIEVSLISLAHLKINKKASGRLKDLSDLENLP